MTRDSFVSRQASLRSGEQHATAAHAARASRYNYAAYLVQPGAWEAAFEHIDENRSKRGIFQEAMRKFLSLGTGLTLP